jgi:hypothetical protein
MAFGRLETRSSARIERPCRKLACSEKCRIMKVSSNRLKVF